MSATRKRHRPALRDDCDQVGADFAILGHPPRRAHRVHFETRPQLGRKLEAFGLCLGTQLPVEAEGGRLLGREIRRIG